MSSRQLTPAALTAKAEMACASARALLERGDVDGASNRAYYAMFDAARAVLLASGAPVEPDIGRTHRDALEMVEQAESFVAAMARVQATKRLAAQGGEAPQAKEVPRRREEPPA